MNLDCPLPCRLIDYIKSFKFVKSQSLFKFTIRLIDNDNLSIQRLCGGRVQDFISTLFRIVGDNLQLLLLLNSSTNHHLLEESTILRLDSFDLNWVLFCQELAMERSELGGFGSRTIIPHGLNNKPVGTFNQHFFGNFQMPLVCC